MGLDGGWVVPGYRHVRELGVGAAGRVVLAVHLETGRPVAVKYLAPRLLADPAFLPRFRQEAYLLGGIDDPHLVRFYEYVESPAGAAIVMELVDGLSLASLLKAEGATSPEAALVVLKGSLLGLTAAHRAGIVHRDFKPGNILIREDGGSKLADFGIAVRAGEEVTAAGTPAYMAPEQWTGGAVTPAVDVYAATAVFYECLTGDRPYAADGIPRLALAHRTAPIPVERVPEPLRELVTAGLAKDPLARPETASVFLGKLEAIALAAYGLGWEERGRSHLAERAAILAMLFPLARSAPKGGTALGLSELGRTAGRKTLRRGLVAAAGAALLLIGGTSAVVYAAGKDSPTRPEAQVGPSGSSSPTAGATTPEPSGTGPGGPSGNPSSPGGLVTPATDGPSSPAPDDPDSPSPSTGSPSAPGTPSSSPTVSSPPATGTVTGITISSLNAAVSAPSSGSVTVTVSASGTGPVTITAVFYGGKGATYEVGRASTSVSGQTSYQLTLSANFSSCPEDYLSANASGTPGGVQSDTATQAARCPSEPQ